MHPRVARGTLEPANAQRPLPMISCFIDTTACHGVVLGGAWRLCGELKQPVGGTHAAEHGRAGARTMLKDGRVPGPECNHRNNDVGGILRFRRDIPATQAQVVGVLSPTGGCRDASTACEGNSRVKL